MKTLSITIIAIIFSLATTAKANTNSFEMQTVNGESIEVVSKLEALVEDQMEFHYNIPDGHIMQTVKNLMIEEQPLNCELASLNTRKIFNAENSESFVLTESTLENFIRPEKEIDEESFAGSFSQTVK